MDDILLFVKNVGLPGSLLVGLVIGLYKLGTLAIREIGVPVAMKHCRYLDKSLAIMDKISEKMEAGICRAPPGASACTEEDRQRLKKVLSALNAGADEPEHNNALVVRSP